MKSSMKSIKYWMGTSKKDKNFLWMWSALLLLILVTYGLTIASTAILSSHSRGSVACFMNIGISDHGNLINFESPSGMEHITVGAIGEGYAKGDGGAL
jgi:hypothetical protein